jgi:hypothetical protein
VDLRESDNYQVDRVGSNDICCQYYYIEFKIGWRAAPLESQLLLCTVVDVSYAEDVVSPHPEASTLTSTTQHAP